MLLLLLLLSLLLLPLSLLLLSLMLLLLCFCCYRFVVVAGHLKSLHLQKPGFSPFENKAGPTDELTDGPTG